MILSSALTALATSGRRNKSRPFYQRRVIGSWHRAAWVNDSLLVAVLEIFLLFFCPALVLVLLDSEVYRGYAKEVSETVWAFTTIS